MTQAHEHNPAGTTNKVSVEEDITVATFEGSFAPNARPSKRSSVPWYRDASYFVDGWLNGSIWRSAVVECVATACMVYVGGLAASTLISYNTPQIGGYIGIFNIFLLSLFIYATAPASGGHINPMITFSAMLAGICPLPRAVLYMCGQTLGAALGGGILRGVWGLQKAQSVNGGGCFFNPANITTSQVFVNEIFASIALLYLAFGTGLDPRQAIFFGPRIGPLLVGASLGLVSFASSGIAPGYSGASMNPARCFAFGIARGNMSYQWIWWFGPAVASVLLAIFYNTIPPHHATETTKSEDPAHGHSQQTSPA